MFEGVHDLLTSARANADGVAVWFGVMAGLGLVYAVVVLIVRAEVRRIMRGYVVNRVLQPRDGRGRYRKTAR